MDPVIAFFKGLFATDQWPARWHCGSWTDFHGWLYIISDLMIWLAYFLIPLVIFQYFTKKRRVKFERVYILFTVFILLCGATYFFDAVMFWVPMYRLNALLRLVTGITGFFAVYHLIKILSQVFKEKTNVALEAEIQRRQAVEKQLDEATANLQAFGSVASHDLQEPLRKIRTYVSVIGNVSEPVTEERKKELLEKIDHCSDRMQSMLKDILTLSTIMISADFGRVNINDAVRLAIEDMEVMIAGKKAIIDVQLMPDVKGNREYLSQVFMNLISNAIKFARTTPQISITCETKETTIVIYVKDNGIGMDNAYTERIFLVFQRLNPRTDYDGSGLGLAICKRIIDLHRGTIRVETELGLGTTFIIELPRA